MQHEPSFIHVSVREARMCVERILLTCGIPKGYAAAVRDCILLSQSLGLGGFEALHGAHPSLTGADLGRMSAADRPNHDVDFDAGGLHAWLVLPTALDLAVANARRHGRSELRVRNVAALAELPVAAALAPRYGAVAHVNGAGGQTVISVTNGAKPRTVEQADPLLHQALLHGWRFERTRWREIYALSNQALAPDSVVSRRHAGPVLVDAEGRVVGRTPVDDETDLRTLTSV